MKVVLLEHIEEAELFINYCRKRAFSMDQFYIVAIWPSVQAFLKKSNVSYTNTLLYFTNESHHRILLKSEEWLESVEELLSLEDGSGIKESYNSIFKFHLRFYINHFLWVTELLAGICFQHNVECFIACIFEQGCGNTGDVKILNNDRYIGLITKNFANNRGILFEEIPDFRNCRYSPIDRRSVLDWGKNFYLSLVSWAYFFKFKRFCSDSTILVNTLSYNMDKVVNSLQEKFPKIKWVLLQTNSVNLKDIPLRLLRKKNIDIIIPLETIDRYVNKVSLNRKQMEQSLKRVQEMFETKWHKLFYYEGISFTDVFFTKIQGDLFTHIYSLVHKTNTMKIILKKLVPRIIISPFGVGVDGILGELGTILEIPSLSISHGTFTPPQNKPEEIEKYRLGISLILTEYGYTALQTPWAEIYIRHFKEKCKPQPIKTGNLIFAKIDSKKRFEKRKKVFNIQNEETKVIVYATTLKTRASLRFQIHETLDEHLAGIADLVQATKDITNAYLVIKLHPALALKKDEVQLLIHGTKSDQISIVTKLPFHEVLSCADLVVSYSSTCIEEAIQSHIPVMLYDRWNRYRHLPVVAMGIEEKKVVSPVYYVNRAQSLKESLEWILKNHDHRSIPPKILERHIYKKDYSDDFAEFVRKYVM